MGPMAGDFDQVRRGSGGGVMSIAFEAATTHETATDLAYQQCLNPLCRKTLSIDQAVFACPACGDLLDVVYDWDRLPVPDRLSDFEAKWSRRLDPLCFSGVWRFRELSALRAPPRSIVTIGEGQTLLQAGREGWRSTSG